MIVSRYQEQKSVSEDLYRQWVVLSKNAHGTIGATWVLKIGFRDQRDQDLDSRSHHVKNKHSVARFEILTLRYYNTVA
jgi:hypothetical protein